MTTSKYRYRPVRFYLIVFGFTWFFWALATTVSHFGLSMLLMLFGLFVPAVTAITMVFSSRSTALKSDFKRKIIGFYRIKPWSILASGILFGAIVAVSILASTLFGQSLEQFALTEGFSFSTNGGTALLTILLASVIEEVGWRGYGEDAIANYCSWFWESIWFGVIWSLWHLPLFLIDGTYHAGLAQLGIAYVINFMVSVIPLGFITTWVYVKNNRSMLACIIFHMFVNFFQEKIAMTPQTKCVQTAVILLAAILIVLTNKTMFFEKRHVGNLLEEKA